MAEYKAIPCRDGVKVSDLKDFSLLETLDCGQCFRWMPDKNGIWQGIAMGHYLRIRQLGETDFLFMDTNMEQFKQIWEPYFDLNVDYGAIKTALAADPVMAQATQYAPGLRILRQDGWEALCTFIISQNNNIKRIRGIVERLCQCFGEPIEGGYDFPTPQRLAEASLKDLAPLRSGFRAKYLLDAARKVAGGQVDLSRVPQLSYEEAQNYLQQIKGVGPKVADCALLFGFYRMEAFPMDVWMKRAMKSLYPEGLPEAVQPYRGIAQQYLFHYARTNPQLL
ncbi:MAG: DNA-3-methyladenine glycosylase family protein [Negativibacillus sp.]